MPAIPSMTGGAAGPSTATNTQNVGGFGNVYVNRGSNNGTDSWKTLAIVAAVGVGIWYLSRKR